MAQWGQCLHTRRLPFPTLGYSKPCLLLALYLYGQAKVRQLHCSALELGGQQQVLRLPKTREKRKRERGRSQGKADSESHLQRSGFSGGAAERSRGSLPLPPSSPNHRTPALPRDGTTPLQSFNCCKRKTLLQPAKPSFSFQQGLVLGLRRSGAVLLQCASHWAKGLHASFDLSSQQSFRVSTPLLQWPSYILRDSHSRSTSGPLYFLLPLRDLLSL